ncbi:DUF3558 domain-containing protein [Saccharothrix coeruleofusca]|uniref:DUF3558 domain-containing protein n=1 Tax=Saccharothrix coeruleofusca TaxID=33919 RepID=A0A918AWH7_9PSEU|nr:DUF3558 domain-containing protein [Saccharothrix coeruleofusca]GGP80613.1 hypothetical protein GCM10010185_63120 [Saccharothrix coeruleofusca]
MRLINATVLMTVLGSCAIGEDGTPRPVTSNASTSGSTGSATRAPRPEELKVDGVDPCATLTSAQQFELKIDEALNQPLDVLNNDKPAPTCRYRSNGKTLFNYNLSLVSGEGVDYWEGSSNLEVKSESVSGFSAYRYKLSGTFQAYCSYAVDVADDQQLVVQFLPIGEGFSQDQMCQNSARGAELALATLQTLK